MRSRPLKRGYVYIMTNRSRTLYVGVTSTLYVRVQQHKNGRFPGSFTSRYKMDRLVYYQEFVLMTNAIAREKEIKGWTRAKKMQLIVSMNPTWRDLTVDFETVPPLKVRKANA